MCPGSACPAGLWRCWPISSAADIGRGRFITLEGGEGAGKTTQARLLADRISARGLDVLLTREPGGAPGAERLRDLLLSGGIEWSPTAEVLLHFAARAEHVERTIRPALHEGVWVVCDRFVDSTMAYQGYGQGADLAMIRTLAKMVGLRPDLTLVLDLPLDVAAARLKKRGPREDRYEQLPAGFHARVAEGFRLIARDDPDRCVVVDASGSEAEVHAAIMDVVMGRLSGAER